MPWRPLPRIAFAVAIYPFQPSSPADLPLELGDELYIIEQGGAHGEWYRGYLVAPPSLLAGLTSVKGQTLEARVFSGIFPKNCVEVREVLGDGEGRKPVHNDEQLSAEVLNRVNGSDKDHKRDSTTSFSREINEGFNNLLSKESRLSKGSQIAVLQLDEEALKRRSSATTWSPSFPLTPLSVGPRDPNAPKPAAPVPMLKIGDETPTSSAEPLVDEIASCLREWHSTNLHELLLARKYSVLEQMSDIVQELDLARRQLLHNVLTGQERAALREKTVWTLVRGNKMLSGEVIVRDPKQRGRLLTGEDSAIQLTKLQSEMSMLDSSAASNPEPAGLHNLLFEVNAVSGTNSGPVTISMYLCTKLDNGTLQPLTETYILDIPSPESFASLAHSSRLKTLFTEITATDIGEVSGGNAQLYLVATVQTAQSPKINLPPRARSAASRDGALANKTTNTVNSGSKGSLKGRRSVMWTSRPRASPSIDAGKENTRAPPSAGSTASSQDRKDSPINDTMVVRTVGAGVIEVSQIFRQGKDVEQVINIWSPIDLDDEADDHMEGFDELIRSVLPSPTGKYTRSQRAARLHTHLAPFISDDADALIRSNPTTMHNVTQTRRMGFPTAPTKPRSDIYITVSRAMFPHDAFLSHPQAGHVPVPMASGLRNLQLTLEVRNSSGARVERCIYASSNSSGHTAWRSTVAERDASWNETIRLKIPTDQVPGAHLIMSIADAPEFPFALAWMPLWDQQAFLHDGPHSLLLHAYDKSTSSIENGKGAYLSLPWSAVSKKESTKDETVTGSVATLRLDTYLCSTEYSQDQIMLGLINWKEQTADDVLQILKRLVFVPEIEIVKQLSGVFDALFGILVENAGKEEYEDIVFNDLVMVLGIVHDRRFNLGPLVDNYAEKQFNFPFATPCLIRSYLRLLQASTDTQQSRNLRAAFKVGRHLMKFIMNARAQQKAKEEEIGITKIQSSFSRDIHSIFKSLEALMRNPNPILVGSKTLIVQHVHTWLPELSNVLSNDEVVMISLSFMDSCKDVKGLLVLYKLVLIQNYTRIPVFASGSERQTLISSCISWLAPYWGATNDVSDQYRDQVRLCCSVVAELLKRPDPLLYEFMPKIVSSYCAIEAEGVDDTNYLSLLFSKSFPFQVKPSSTKQKFDEGLVELSALMAAVAKIPNPKLPVMKPLDLSTFLAQVLEAHLSILSCDAYPESWLSVHIYNHRAAMKSLEFISSIMIKSLLPSPDDADAFDMKLWEAFFATLLKLVSSDALALETFPEQKRRAVWKIGGDVRELGAELLRRSWEAIGWETTDEERERFGLKRLGGYQVQYVPGLVPPIIELCLSVHEGLRHVAVEVLQTMIISEWNLNQDLAIIETEVISSLDHLFKTKHMNESITQKLFINELLDLFHASRSSDEGLSASVREFIATIDELLDLLVASHSGDMNESLHTLKLMEFMKDMGREDIFIRYVHELAEVQAAARNYTEAGLALQFHADLYDWDPNKLMPAVFNPPLLEESSFERKESLYFQIIQYFEDGKAWAHALACYRELAYQYENTIMDFSKLSRSHSSIARIYDAVAKEDKQFPRYFRVVYKGLGFPPTLRDKEYIYEAYPFERMAAFTDRMRKQHPAAQIMSSGEIDDLEGQFLQINSVSVHRDMGHPVYQRSKLPSTVREHLLISVPNQFSMTAKKHTSGTDVKEQWVAKTIFTTAEPFPNILRRSEVVAADELVLSPLQTAIERTWRKTQELLLLEKRAIAGDDPSLSALTEALSQLLELNSSSPSCVALYRQFLTEEQPQEEGEMEQGQEEVVRPIDPLENALAVALIDHALAIKHCLNLFSRPAHQATQAELTRRFEEAFAPELASLSAQPPQSQSQESPHLLGYRSPSLGNGVGQQSPNQRSTSPEQELIRSSRSRDRKNGDKHSVSHRISVMNPFRRSHHPASGSVVTVNGHSDGRRPSEAKSNGETIRDDDDAATIHSRTTSRSRGGKSDTHSKRRSWFGGDKSHKFSPSVSAAEISMEDVDATPRRQPSTASRLSKSNDRRRSSSMQRTSSMHRTSSKREKPSNSSRSALPAANQERPETAGSRSQSIKEPVVNSPSSTAATNAGSVRDSVMKRFSLLKGVGRKNSRLGMGDFNGSQINGNGFNEPLREE